MEKAVIYPPRAVWKAFPDAVLLADELAVKQHPDYSRAKAGDVRAATSLVSQMVDETGVDTVRTLIAHVGTGDTPMFVSAHAYERHGVNAIPGALASFLSERTGIPYETVVVQTNIVSHTSADGYGRLARQACFGGQVDRGREYVMVDDFVGQGGTLANLRGWIEKQGGRAVGAIVLTGKPYSAKLSPSKEQRYELRQRHGADFEEWWQEHFGHSFDCLTQSEARYLTRSPDVDTIRNKLAAAKQEGSSRGRTRNPHG